MSEKKKALLITWYRDVNYGTELQAYSLFKILEDSSICKIDGEKVNFDVSLLNYKVQFPNNTIKQNNIIKKIKNKYKNGKLKLVKRFYANNMRKKEDIVNNFIKRNFKLFPSKEIKKEDLEKINTDFDVYVSGSDQIWNPKLLDTTYLLNWVKQKRKIAYASCISTSKIPEDSIDKYKCISTFEKVMIRDNNESKKQLEKIINKPVYTVVDPVILLGKNIIKEDYKQKNGEKFILSYLLSNDISSRKKALKMSNKNNIKLESIVCVNYGNLDKDFILRKNAIWDVGPIDFVKKIIDSELLITDSFHAIVLAILFNKNFVCLKREENQKNRIEELLKAVGLEKMLNNFSEDISDFKIDKETWNEVNEKINKLRKKSYDELVEVLKDI